MDEPLVWLGAAALLLLAIYLLQTYGGCSCSCKPAETAAQACPVQGALT